VLALVGRHVWFRLALLDELVGIMLDLLVAVFV
jgi:hypothetical protein